jgi:hypothetical protein
MGDLIRKANDIVGTNHNPFTRLTPQQKNYLDALAIIRNYVVHQSDAAEKAYKGVVQRQYGLRKVRSPQYLLATVERRRGNPLVGNQRIYGLMEVVKESISAT